MTDHSFDALPLPMSSQASIESAYRFSKDMASIALHKTMFLRACSDSKESTSESDTNLAAAITMACKITVDLSHLEDFRKSASNRARCIGGIHGWMVSKYAVTIRSS